uniref:Pr1-like protein n=1 Tax=Oryza sativa subsp. japonica TaxID=39947 RepID=Q6YUD6_ORYSJ|nr:pr1-like protein [Oryza sativa Japonica Group]
MYLLRQPREGARGPDPRGWGPRGSPTAHGGPGAPGLAPAGAVGPTRQPHLRAWAADSRAPHGSRGARPKAATPAQPTGGGAPVRRSGGRERGGKGETNRRSTAHPGSTATTGTATTGTATGAEEGGGAARVDGVDGAPVVGVRNGGVDEVGEDAAKPKEAAPRGGVVRGDNGGGPELGGDGGERERRRELDSGGEKERRVAETVEGGTGRVYIGLGGGESGRTRGKRARKIRPPLMAPARLGERFPNESEGEREGKMGGKRDGITGNISPPLYCARGRRKAAVLGHGRGGGSGGR